MGILGGSFDPVQNAHIALADWALKSKKVASVVFVPTGKNPFKSNGPIASSSDRIQMLNLALKGSSNCYISDIETSAVEKNPEIPSYTFKTVSQIKSVIPNKEVFFLCGSDLLDSFHEWNQSKELVALLSGILVFPRDKNIEQKIERLSFHFSPLESSKFIKMDFDDSYQDISATKVRSQIMHNHGIEDIVPKRVSEYIISSALYRE